jgi:AcrR family transcriptional regulator
MSPRPNVETERRQQILEAAMACFARKGYYSTTMDDITAELPFSKGLLYYYFKTKRDLFLAILDDWMVKSMMAWEMMLSPDDDAPTQLYKCLEFGVQLLTLNTDLARVEFEFYNEVGRDAAVANAIQTLFTEFRTQLKIILDAGIARGEFRPMNTDALAAVLLGAYEGLAMQAIVDPDILDWSAIVESLLDMVMWGISPIGKE